MYVMLYTVQLGLSDALCWLNHNWVYRIFCTLLTTFFITNDTAIFRSYLVESLAKVAISSKVFIAFTRTKKNIFFSLPHQLL